MEVELCNEEESLPGLVSGRRGGGGGAQDGLQEVRFVVQSRSKF